MNKYLDTITPTDIQALYQRDDGPSIIMSHVRHVLSEFSADPGSDEGRKAIKSMARKIASLKTRCERERKTMTATMRSELDRIYARSRRLCEALDAIRDDVRQPVTEFEQHMEQAKQEWTEANVKPSGPSYSTPGGIPEHEPGVADIAEFAISGIPDISGETAFAMRRAQIIEDIKQDISCKSMEQIAEALVDGRVRHVRVDA